MGLVGCFLHFGHGPRCGGEESFRQAFRARLIEECKEFRFCQPAGAAVEVLADGDWFVLVGGEAGSKRFAFRGERRDQIVVGGRGKGGALFFPLHNQMHGD